MSLIDEALKRADGSGADPPAPARPPSNWKAVAVAACCTTLGLSVLVLHTGAPEAETPQRVQAEETSDSPPPATAPAENIDARSLPAEAMAAAEGAARKDSSAGPASALRPGQRPEAAPGGQSGPFRLALDRQPFTAAAPRRATATSRNRRRTAPAYRLGGILRSEVASHAIINDHMVGVGDEIDGARVLAIERYYVDLEKDGRRIRLRM